MKINILKITALCASIALASSANAQTIGFQVTPTSGNPTSDIIMTVNDASGFRAVDGSPLSALSVKINAINTGGSAYGIYAAGSLNPVISNDIYVETTRAGSNAVAIQNTNYFTLQGDITLSAKTATGSATVFNNSTVNVYSNGGTHTLFGGVLAVDFNMGSGKYIWDSYSNDINLNLGNGAIINADIEFMKRLRVSSGTLQTNGHLTFHASEISSQSLFHASTLIFSGNTSTQFTVILDEGFEAFENDELIIWSGTSMSMGFFDHSNVSIVLSSTGEELSYGTGRDFIVSNIGVVTFLKDISVAIPEPSTYAMIFGVLALGLAIYRRRK